MPRRSTPRELAVWANGLRMGLWRLPSRATMEFQYDADWLAAPEARPLSLSLPLPVDAHTPHRGKGVEAYFDNLLPDSDPIRKRLQERFHTGTRDAFDLLAAIGRDCVGAIQILPADETPADTRKIESRVLTEAQIAAELAGVTTAPARDEISDFRISIAGAQEKTAFLKYNGRWCRPVGSTPTTHIFKLPLGLVGNRQADFRTSVENEWLCSRIVAEYGLPIANCEIAQFGDQKVLIVERFDRQLHSSGRYWLRLMQEDMAQATGTPWHRKYQSDGGPGVLEIGRILRGSQQSKTDLTTLFRAQVLFWMLAATDGHAKNFSLRILSGGHCRLTPLYDVLSAWPVIGRRANEIPAEKVKMAMSVPGERPHYLWKSIHRRHFEALGRKLGLGAETTSLIDALAASTDAVVTKVQRGLPKGIPQSLIDRVLDCLRKSAQALTSEAP